ncbi:hypothetical protein BJV82DRAFT_616605 [Fennellomyces sp. T-0311]|nr:hypothetical protein BJV82DRAFT_616605 [Fennellomyces sp. T-0311]
MEHNLANATFPASGPATHDYYPPPDFYRKRSYNPLTIDNPYLSLLSLIDITYPPLICSACDKVSPTIAESKHHQRTAHRSTRRHRCLHPHCELSFASRAALRFHLSRSHLIHQAPLKHVQPEPPFMHYRLHPPLGYFQQTTRKPSYLIADHPPSTKQAARKPSRSSLAFKIHTAKSFAQQSAPSSSSTLQAPTTVTPRQTLSPASEALINSIYHPLHCPCCHEHFPRKTNVIKHVAEMHHDQKPYSCVYANCTAHRKSYATRDDLVYHTLRVHDNGDTNSENHQLSSEAPPLLPQRPEVRWIFPR